jgi:hypothetical protein
MLFKCAKLLWRHSNPCPCCPHQASGPAHRMICETRSSSRIRRLSRMRLGNKMLQGRAL